jgi:RNA polymerase sigma factor (sigma-70 family)
MSKEKFIATIRSNQNLIYKICYSYCYNPDLRKDLEQEILLQLWRSFNKFDGRVKISTWMYRIALNTAISFLRNDKKFKNQKLSIHESIISLPSNEYEVEQDENVALLYEFINMLNELDKALILLYLDDFKHKEISAVLGISESNVATKMHRIKNNLKEQFKKH